MTQTITFTFPADTPSASDFFDYLKAILADAPHIRSQDGGITLAVSPENAHPATTFLVDKHSDFPAVSVGTVDVLGQLHPRQASLPHAVVEKHDEQGMYYEVPVKDMTLYRL